MYLTITIGQVPQCLSIEELEGGAAERFRCAILENFSPAVSLSLGLNNRRGDIRAWVTVCGKMKSMATV